MRRVKVTTVLASRLWLVAALLCGSWAISLPVSAVPNFLPFQGRLVDVNGSPVNGSQNLTFRIYRSPGATTTPLWTEAQTLPVNQGIFSVDLGKVTPLALPFDRPYWVSFQVQGGTEMTPFVRLTTVPYALAVDSGAVFSDPLNITGRFRARPPLFVVDTALNRVGIGTASPTDTLHVAGTCNIQDTLLVEDTISATAFYENGGAIYPPGSLYPFAGSSVPGGYLLCNGQAVSRTTYAALFAAIGTIYGNGDGATTFNVPNLQGRVPMGYTATLSEFNAIGKTGGVTSVSLSGDEVAYHSHAINSFLVNLPNDGAHTHQTWFGLRWTKNTGAAAYIDPAYGGSASGVGSMNTTGAHTHTVDPAPVTSSANGGGTGGAHMNVMPYLTVNYVIKY